MENQSKWIWYPGEYEIYHALVQNSTREERGYRWPAYWAMPNIYPNVKFHNVYQLSKNETICIYSQGIGHVKVNDMKYALNQKIIVDKGSNEIEIVIFNNESFPAVYIEGETIKSDESWFANRYLNESVEVGLNDYYLDKDIKPNALPYKYKKINPIQIKIIQNDDGREGTLIDFGKEIFGKFVVEKVKLNEKVKVCYGESLTEATDVDNCYFWDWLDEMNSTFCFESKAYRYVFLPSIRQEDINVYAKEEYLSYDKISKFTSSDQILNKIWDVSKYTFELNSRIFFLDGIKRDQWIWSGDAYQSYFINQYLHFDKSLNERTMVALYGKEPIEQHINTIVDYSLFWIIGVYNHYFMTGQLEFLKKMYPKMESMLNYCMQGLDDQGFLVGKEGDWIFIDWANFDKEGPFCALQILYARCLEIMDISSSLLGISKEIYSEKYKYLKSLIHNKFWDSEKGAFIDGFYSGEKKVTRHANIFAILFGYVNEEQKQSIINKVLLNDNISAITTPYFKFYEMEVFCFVNKHEKVLEEIKSYWGGMLDLGATTFWEEYDKNQTGKEHYSMYGDPYGKSLCHAWGASPIYLYGRYFIGLRPTEAGYNTYEIQPSKYLPETLKMTLPLNEGWIKIEKKDEILMVYTVNEGGKIIIEENAFQIIPNCWNEYII